MPMISPRRLLARLLCWILNDELDRYECARIRTDAMHAERAGYRAQWGRIESRMLSCETALDQTKALQAIDTDFHNSGKLIICARVGGRDVVKILDIPRTMTVRDHVEMVKRIEHQYGAKLTFRDVTVPIPLWDELARS